MVGKWNFRKILYAPEIAHYTGKLEIQMRYIWLLDETFCMDRDNSTDKPIDREMGG